MDLLYSKIFNLLESYRCKKKSNPLNQIAKKKDITFFVFPDERWNNYFKDAAEMLAKV